ncbi:phosphoglycerate kinase [Mangrovicoccus ximenensis]|uniref:phosphoglycerate kinase n=1 Tax=Mangrovicoccus ximenensis TaxID=1911570 RepID=UPI00191C3E04|nr:phosphoglycerate kinase [Mangrovicoccus ximenensis]
MAVPSILDADVRGRRVLVRADLNVPVEDGRVTDATRIERFAEGMRVLLERGARLVILTHFGRPDAGERNPDFSVDKLRPALSKALGVQVKFSDVCADESAVILSRSLRDGEALLCENLRYNAGETGNDPGFAAELARLGDLYVNDAFSCAHRAHASTHALAGLLPAYAGPLLIGELDALSASLDAPERPACAIVGGAKVSTKIAVLKNLVTRLDHVIIGGGMANTFLAARGAPMGRSLHEPGELETVQEIFALAQGHGCRLHLPLDVVVAREFRAFAPADTVASLRARPAGCLRAASGFSTRRPSGRRSRSCSSRWPWSAAPGPGSAW